MILWWWINNCRFWNPQTRRNLLVELDQQLHQTARASNLAGITASRHHSAASVSACVQLYLAQHSDSCVVCCSLLYTISHKNKNVLCFYLFIKYAYFKVFYFANSNKTYKYVNNNNGNRGVYSQEFAMGDKRGVWSPGAEPQRGSGGGDKCYDWGTCTHVPLGNATGREARWKFVFSLSADILQECFLFTIGYTWNHAVNVAVYVF